MSKVVKVSDRYCLLKKTGLIVYVSTGCVLLVQHLLDLLLLFFQISGGWRHTMALTSDGKLYGWGWNKVKNILPLVFIWSVFLRNV